MAGRNKLKDLPKKRNPIARDLASPLFKKQVLPDKSKAQPDKGICLDCNEIVYNCVCDEDPYDYYDD